MIGRIFVQAERVSAGYGGRLVCGWEGSGDGSCGGSGGSSQLAKATLPLADPLRSMPSARKFRHP